MGKKFISLVFILIIGFWLLDSFYLMQERKYRQLYKNIIEKDEEEIDFSLDTSKATRTNFLLSKCIVLNCARSNIKGVLKPFNTFLTTR